MPVWEDDRVQSDISDITSREEFRSLAAVHRVVPVTRKVLADSETPLSAYRKLAANRPGTFLLESAENGRSWSRWSFIGAGAPSALSVRDGSAVWLGEAPAGAPTGGDPLTVLRDTLALLETEPLPDLPPLSGGMVGFFAYDLVRRLERLPELTTDDLGLPDLLMLLATDVLRLAARPHPLHERGGLQGADLLVVERDVVVDIGLLDEAVVGDDRDVGLLGPGDDRPRGLGVDGVQHEDVGPVGDRGLRLALR